METAATTGWLDIWLALVLAGGCLGMSCTSVVPERAPEQRRIRDSALAKMSKDPASSSEKCLGGFSL